MKKYCVAGYKGIIGSYILNGLIKYLPTASDILCFDVYDKPEVALAKIDEADVVFNCVSFNNTIDFLNLYNINLRGKILIDQTSWKTDVYEWSKMNPEVMVYFMHILYNPDNTVMEDRQILTFEHPMGESWNNIFDHCDFSRPFERFITHGLLAERVVIDDHYDKAIADHDKMMAIQQPEFYDYLDELVKKCGTSAYGTQNYRELLKMRDRVRSMNPDLMEGLRSNPYYKKK